MISAHHNLPYRVLHILNLDTIGGVEQLFTKFIQIPKKNTEQSDTVLITGKKIHSDLISPCRNHLKSVYYAKYWHGVKIPKKVLNLRKLHVQRVVKDLQPNIGILWNRFGDVNILNTLHSESCKALYYEHGSAWLAQDTPLNRGFISRIDAVLCASYAAQRVIQLRWGYTGKIDVILNCLRPDILPANPKPKALPKKRAVRIGIAARLIPLKGIGVALHALANIKKQHSIELHIAGDGPLKKFLIHEAKQLDLESSVFFHNYIKNMSSFYQFIDLLLVPSVREPFGLVILEAAAHGCPAICAKIDGIPEVMSDGETGICIKPTLDLPSGSLFGGRPIDFPSIVYEPDEDKLVKPKFVDPEILGSAISSLLNKPSIYSNMSKNSIKHAKQFSIDDYSYKLRRAFKKILVEA